MYEPVLYFHSECRGCVSFGTECEESCEYSESPNQCPFFKSIEEDELIRWIEEDF